jgi:hypothetical protein
MATNLVDSSAFTPDVTVPDDGDARNAASVRGAFQSLANRSRWLKNLLEMVDVSTGSFDYRTPVDKVFQVNLEDGTAGSAGAGVSQLWFDPTSGLHFWNLSANNVVAVFPIRVPTGSTLKTVAGQISMSTAGAPGQMKLSVWKKDGLSNTAVQLGTTSTAAAGTGVKSVSVTGLSEVGVGNVSYFAAFQAGSGAGTPADGILGVFRTLTDKGPR